MAIPILLYHHIIPDDQGSQDPFRVTASCFQHQMSRLKERGFSSATLGEALDQAAVPGNPDRKVVITFDDGYENNYRLAFPVLAGQGLSAAIFLLPGLVGGQTPQIADPLMTMEQIKEMQAVGFEFQSHGLSHTSLLNRSDSDVNQEVHESRQRLSQMLGAPVDFFAYPFGQFDVRIAGAVQAAGYRGACGGTPALDGRIINPYAMGRSEIFEMDQGWRWDFKVKTGYDPRLYLRKQGGRIRRLLNASGLRNAHV